MAANFTNPILHVIYAGRGDCFLLEYRKNGQREFVLIDGGPIYTDAKWNSDNPHPKEPTKDDNGAYFRYLLNTIMQVVGAQPGQPFRFNPKAIFVTHLHNDHFGGIVELFRSSDTALNDFAGPVILPNVNVIDIKKGLSLDSFVGTFTNKAVVNNTKWYKTNVNGQPLLNINLVYPPPNLNGNRTDGVVRLIRTNPAPTVPNAPERSNDLNSESLLFRLNFKGAQNTDLSFVFNGDSTAEMIKDKLLLGPIGPPRPHHTIYKKRVTAIRYKLDLLDHGLRRYPTGRHVLDGAIDMPGKRISRGIRFFFPADLWIAKAQWAVTGLGPGKVGRFTPLREIAMRTPEKPRITFDEDFTYLDLDDNTVYYRFTGLDKEDTPKLTFEKGGSEVKVGCSVHHDKDHWYGVTGGLNFFNSDMRGISIRVACSHPGRPDSPQSDAYTVKERRTKQRQGIIFGATPSNVGKPDNYVVVINESFIGVKSFRFILRSWINNREGDVIDDTIMPASERPHRFTIRGISYAGDDVQLEFRLENGDWRGGSVVATAPWGFPS